MATLAAVDIVLGLDTKRLERDLTDAERSLVRLRRSGEKMKRFGRALTVGVTAPLTAAAGAAVKLATDAEESANKFDVVMGESADEVRAKLERLTETVPETTVALQRMAAGLQDLLVPMGVARGEAAHMSARMVKLAGDIASFNNVPIAAALEAMKSGLAGMSRPLRQFGVDVRQSRLQTIALEQGLIDSAGEMNTTARAQAVMTAIVRDSKDAIGDAARTADEAANVFRFLKRDVKELGEQFGRVLLPTVRDLAQRISDMLDKLDSMDESTKKLVVSMAALAAAAGPLIQILGTITIAATDLIVTFGTAASGLAVLTGGAILTGLGLLASRIAHIATSAEGAVQPLSEMRGEVDELVESVKDLTKAQAEQQLLTAAGQVQKLTAEINKLDRQIAAAEDSARMNGRMLDTMTQSEIEAAGSAADLRQQKQKLMEQARQLQARMSALSTVINENMTQPAKDADSAFGDLTDTIRELGRTMLSAIPRLDIRTLGPLDTPGFKGFNREQLRTARQAGGPFSGVVTGQERLGAFRNTPGIIGSAARSADRFNQHGEDARSTFEVLGTTLSSSVMPAIAAVTNASENMARSILQLAGSILQSLGQLKGVPGPVGVVGGILGAFAGFFHKGGTIPSGQFGLVGEKGPEFVAGPAEVRPMAATSSGPVIDASDLDPAGQMWAEVAMEIPSLQRLFTAGTDNAARRRGR